MKRLCNDTGCPYCDHRGTLDRYSWWATLVMIVAIVIAIIWSLI
jgi:hypothetical protein